MFNGSEEEAIMRLYIVTSGYDQRGLSKLLLLLLLLF